MQNVVGCTLTLRSSSTKVLSTTTDEIERSLTVSSMLIRGTYVSVLDCKRLLDTRSKHLEHGSVLRIIANVLKNVTVGYDAKSTENNNDGNLLAGVRQSCLHNVSGLQMLVIRTC